MPHGPAAVPGRARRHETSRRRFSESACPRGNRRSRSGSSPQGTTDSSHRVERRPGDRREPGARSARAPRSSPAPASRASSSSSKEIHRGRTYQRRTGSFATPFGGATNDGGGYAARLAHHDRGGARQLVADRDHG